ncbi:unnamed protein product [Microthlaspi erraticum]|uniref:DUF4283 domain-containing protein n=1 Tax=Microthlaspi erraticum TaxID=1685480 RepID=A0A6D2K915_9BRAS|nr:unnamed protein product [Microthlaspi erraticum]
MQRGGSSNMTRRRLDLEEEIIQLPACDLTSAAVKFKNTVIGRMFNKDGTNMDAVIGMLPKQKIWDVEGRARGISLGNGQFQFDFDTEEDMLKVLRKRPWHFNRWSFSLEKWEPFTSELFPNTMLFWVKTTGVPMHFWNDDNFNEIGKALGTVVAIDAVRARFQVSVNADAPLQFERKVGFPNGDVGTVTFEYVGLHRYCFTCKLLSHEEGMCPQLTEKQKERNKELRAEQKDPKGPVASSYPNENRRTPLQGSQQYGKNDRGVKADTRDYVRSSYRDNRYGMLTNQARETVSRDLRYELKDKRESRGKDVWKRIERPVYSRDYNKSDRYHPYTRARDYKTSLVDRRYDSHDVWRPRQYNSRDNSQHLDTPQSRASAHFNNTRGTPMDSQRTVSELRHDPVINRKGSGLLVVHPKESDAERARKMKGKTHITDDSEEVARKKRDILLGKSIRTLAIREPQTTNGQSVIAKPVLADSGKHINGIETGDTGEKDSTLPNAEDGEFFDDDEDQFLEDLEEPQLDDTMMENDDLLGEEMEAEAELLEAISQLSPPPNPEPIQEDIQQLPVNSKPAIKETTRTKTSSGPRRRVHNPLERKGTSASRKLQPLRAIASPKKKQRGGIQTTTTASSLTVPRHEVFPSATSKRSTTKSGSVVSQKPPIKKI